MSTIPVVWCTDVNSNNKKPIAFALEGIQLQGNLSEQHVLAVRELVDAAAEGRLLLPTDGVIVVLECGVGVGSVIIQDSNKLRELNLKNKLGEGERSVNAKNTAEVPYEFLCCARCMTNSAKTCHSHRHTSEVFAKYLSTKKSKGLKRYRSTNMRVTNFKRKNLTTLKIERRMHRETKNAERKAPMYATVDKLRKHKNRRLRETESSGRVDRSTGDSVDANVLTDGLGRKTSFDSTCTISSMDSGFMDMQNKLESTKNSLKAHEGECKIAIIVHPSKEDEATKQNAAKSSTNWSRLTVPSQSRNRRKSYEEFKSLFCDHQKLGEFSRSGVTNKSRRKSHEEFKSRVSCDASCANGGDTISSSIYSQQHNVTASLPLNGEIAGNYPPKMKRKNSKRVSTRSQTISQAKKDSLYDILKEKCLQNISGEKSKKVIYDKNLELFKNHCSVNDIKKINPKSGGIYDIVQKESGSESIKFTRHDSTGKYMTYGTLYEILHRKSDEKDKFERTLSEKLSKKRNNYGSIDFKAESGAKITAVATDSCDDNLNSSGTMTSASSMKQGSKGANNQLSINSMCSQQLSTIYDILQTKKLDTADVHGNSKQKSRFLVRKITEEELIESRRASDVVDGEANVKKVSGDQTTPKNRIRKFSNILSYQPKATTESHLKVPTFDNETKNLEANIDDLYSRLNRLAKKNESQHLNKIPGEKSAHKLSASVETVAQMNKENDDVNIKSNPARKISVPSRLPVNPQSKRATRRLSEFTRGEFLNEKP